MPNQPPNNKATRILTAASAGSYGIPGVVCYNLETIAAVRLAAEARRSPAQILLFPWAVTYASGLLVHTASAACRDASVPMTLHLDHAQSGEAIRAAIATGKFDSIMVDMSHFEKEENLARTTELVAACHEAGISAEAEPGRIEGGESGVKDTGDLEGMLTTPEEAGRFIDTGIDFLAPAFGNVHGAYNGVENIHLDYERLEGIRGVARRKGVQLVMHGTNEFTEEILKKCVSAGMTRLNVNELVVGEYQEWIRDGRAGKLALVDRMEEGTRLIQRRVEWLMDVIGSSGRAGDVQ